MALGCDLIVASDTARFAQISSKRGLSIDFGASWLLPRLIGLHRAKELAFFADILDAQLAAEFGLVNRVLPTGRAGRVRDRVGRPSGRWPSVGPLDDQVDVEQLVQLFDGAGPRGGVPVAGGQLQHRGHQGSHRRLLPEEGSEVQRAVTLGSGRGLGTAHPDTPASFWLFRYARLSLVPICDTRYLMSRTEVLRVAIRT